MASSFCEEVIKSERLLTDALETQTNITTASHVVSEREWLWRAWECFLQQSHTGDISTKCTAIQSCIDGLVVDGIPAATQQWTTAVSDQKAALGVSLDAQQSALNAAEGAVTRFVTEELMADLPTGTTPQRRGFSYPHTLSHTKPHSVLLEEYHAITNDNTSPSVDESPIASVSYIFKLHSQNTQNSHPVSGGIQLTSVYFTTFLWWRKFRGTRSSWLGIFSPLCCSRWLSQWVTHSNLSKPPLPNVRKRTCLNSPSHLQGSNESGVRETRLSPVHWHQLTRGVEIKKMFFLLLTTWIKLWCTAVAIVVLPLPQHCQRNGLPL